MEIKIFMNLTYRRRRCRTESYTYRKWNFTEEMKYFSRHAETVPIFAHLSTYEISIL